MKSGVSLQQMLTEVKRQSESKEDYLIAPNRLRMESYGKEMFLHLSDDSGTELIEPMTITGIAHRQIGTHLRIPAAYYDRMREERPDLLAYNANTWFKQENSQRMLRTLDGSARAYLSNRYRRIDNIDIAGVTLPILGGLPNHRKPYVHQGREPPLAGGGIPRRHCAGRGHHQQQRGRTWFRQHPAADLSAGVQQRHGRE